MIAKLDKTFPRIAKYNEKVKNHCLRAKGD